MVLYSTLHHHAGTHVGKKHQSLDYDGGSSSSMAIKERS